MAKEYTNEDQDLDSDCKPPILGDCAYCGAPSEGEYAIHRDGFGVGPEVPLCNTCGGGALPTCDEIWDRISERS